MTWMAIESLYSHYKNDTHLGLVLGGLGTLVGQE
jgi:hypothetical protein